MYANEMKRFFSILNHYIHIVTAMKNSLGFCFNIIVCHFLVELFYKGSVQIQKLLCGCDNNFLVVSKIHGEPQSDNL